MPEDVQPASIGRAPDRGVARRHAFLEAAREEFLQRGYEAANVNDVVRRAGGSLATLYGQFGNKEGLFLAVMEDQHHRFVSDFMPDGVDHLPLEQGLEKIGAQMLRAFLKRDHLAFYRIIVGEGGKFPHLLQRYIGAGAEKVRAAISDYMASHATTDGRRIESPEIAGSFFFELMRARHHYRALSDAEFSLTEDQLNAHVKAAVRLFLSGALTAKA